MNDSIAYESMPYGHDEVKEFTALLCDGYKLTGSFTLNEIEKFVRAECKQHPKDILLATLDDPDQAFYTCGHSIMSHDLNNTDGYDLKSLPPHQFEDGEHIGYLRTPEEFFIRKKNFLKNVEGKSLSDLSQKRCWSGITDPVPSLLVPKTVYSLSRENRSYIQIVNVETCYEALAAFPNGYFADDCDPFQNYILAKHLYKKFGFKLFGVGATYLGFMTDSVLNETVNLELASFLASLYKNYEDDIPHYNVIAELLAGNTAFYVAYADR